MITINDEHIGAILKIINNKIANIQEKFEVPEHKANTYFMSFLISESFNINMLNDIYQETKEKMEKSLNSLKKELKRVRKGRASM